MAALRNYQYETSPRKIEPEYSPNRSRRNNNGLKNDNRRNIIDLVIGIQPLFDLH